MYPSLFHTSPSAARLSFFIGEIFFSTELEIIFFRWVSCSIMKHPLFVPSL